MTLLIITAKSHSYAMNNKMQLDVKNVSITKAKDKCTQLSSKPAPDWIA